ncbi:MAG TPA: hypothetical protein VGR82_15335 [Methylomirabilota bacterium]|jgi:hypothetical protein|nr:hypothetical protein [Methylomirabilota bacterium]
MDASTFLRELVIRIEPNATVIDVQESEATYRISMAGTTGVVAACELSRDEVEAASRSGEAHRRVASALKRCADDVVAPIGDGRA